ncbi:MAG TPA: CRTAC1 family protein, partial [Chryseosolibacter sp.]|nr:CRTAC1 family protein [Chryseosolibacter sp.]
AIALASCILPVDAMCQEAFFQDVTEQSGIRHQFAVYEGMFGGGACVIDINNDGWEDLFITGGMNEDMLYVNNRNGTFSNIYATSGLDASRGYVTQGAAAADINKDGWTDLFVTTITVKDSVKKIPRAENLFFLNNGNSTFRNATAEYGLDQLQSFSTGVSFGDFDLDGFTDAYVGNYFIAYEGSLSQINDATIVSANQTAEGYLLRNVEGKRFENVYEDRGLAFRGFGFGGVFTDMDNDHDLDLFVNHDFGYKATPSLMLENSSRDNSFRDVSKDVALDLKINAMGIAPGDYNNDGIMEYYVTNIRFNRFMVRADERQPFTDKAKEAGMDYVSISWGANFADFDHDRDLDLFVANGDLNPNVVPMADYYFENTGSGFHEIAPRIGLNDYGIGRGSVVFDMDHDGDLDILVVNQKPVLAYPVTSTTRLFRNEAAKGNWFKVRLAGIETDTHGIGSKVAIVAGKTRMIREIDGGSSHLSQNTTIAHFGIGDAAVVDTVVITWLGGKKQIFTNMKANSILTVTEVPGKFKSTPVSYLLSGGIVAIVCGFLFYLLSTPRRFRRSMTIGR